MTEAFEQFLGNFRWMGWNLILAIIPCLLSFVLFNRRSPRRISQNLMWWLGLIVFILFLPNAPYILTDIIHFVDDTRSLDISPNGVIFVLIPQYMVFMLLGFQCYVISLLRLTQYLNWVRLSRYIPFIEIAISFVCAIGVYWGRFNRLNSWYVLTQPRRVIQDALSNFGNAEFFLGVFLFFVIFTSLYYLFKWINQAIVYYWQNRNNQVPI